MLLGRFLHVHAEHVVDRLQLTVHPLSGHGQARRHLGGQDLILVCVQGKVVLRVRGGILCHIPQYLRIHPGRSGGGIGLGGFLRHGSHAEREQQAQYQRQNALHHGIFLLDLLMAFKKCWTSKLYQIYIVKARYT